MLPHPSDSSFPAELKKAREALGLSRAAFAERVGVHKVMIGRYEEPTTRTFAKPNESTMLKLNRALGYLSEGDVDRAVAAEPAAAPLPKPVLQRALQQATVEELVETLVARGLEPTLRPLPSLRETSGTV